jgi:hypothetical protein
MPTVLAVVLAFECDNYSLQNQDPAWLSWAEGAALAAVMACAGLLVVQWLQEDWAALHFAHTGPRWIPVLLSASIGALFGGTIPRWYRKTLRRSDSPLASAPLDPTLLSRPILAGSREVRAVSGIPAGLS